MQPSADLQDARIMLDYVKRVKKWTMMACHVYDSVYCHIMAIVVCDMYLNVVLARHGIPEPKFKGFMEDNA
jgi:hypothetical protein